MKNTVIILFLTSICFACTSKSPYLGQEPPGVNAQVFAPGLVSTLDWEIGGVFTPDFKEFYFLREVGEKEKDKIQVFMVFKQNDKGEWKESIISRRVGQAIISPDGKTMHLGRRYKERMENGEWSEIKKLGAPYDSIPIMRMTSSLNGTYAFDEIGMPNGDSVLRYSQLINGQRELPQPFPKEINTGKHNAHPFIAPDESYVLWDGQRDDGPRNAEIYVSFKQADGSWGEAIKLGKGVNTKASEFGARVTPDGKYLFFNRNVGKVKPTDKYENTDIFWVDAQVIEKLRPKQ
ncbi:hypothetical protein [Pseudotenacibaculum haliotis]|uniref:WD40-like Beta Propeller Repeat n=1 Tax=Pseudotenacibaculum haliotis TaxID=1862138 RepID=A0ABW5LUL4_9FLAO